MDIERLIFADTMAHPNDPLPKHLERVAERAADSVSAAVSEVTTLAWHNGLFHDIGKATPWFQRYLIGNGKRSALSNHAELGAVIAWWYSEQLAWPLWQRIALFIAIRRHHGALNFQEWHQLLMESRYHLSEENSDLWQQLQAIDLEGIAQWLIALAHRHPSRGMPTTLPTPDPAQIRAALDTPRRSQLRHAFAEATTPQALQQALMLLAAFGALLSIDKSDAALQGGTIGRHALPSDAVARYRQKMVEDLKNRESGTSPLNQQRDQIAAQVCTTWQQHRTARLFTLTAPTGSGKTLTIFNAAFEQRAWQAATEQQAPRIIYCLPFTSVIDQNHTILCNALREAGVPIQEDHILRHHHLTEPRFRSEGNEYAADGAGQLLTESWFSELVVTTFHQLLHSLLSKRNNPLKRAGRWSGAILLLDEVQAVPLRYWEALRQLLIVASNVLNCRVVLLTATRPLILLPGDAIELLPDHPDHFKSLSRTQLHCHHQHPISLDDFAEKIVAEQQTPHACLIILNRRKAIPALMQRIQSGLKNRKIVTLSTAFTPRERRARIRLLQRLLRHNEAVIAITTQLVEAGVDISFPQVHRDLAPLDAIIQSAGRCNRHQKDGIGSVHLWQIETEPTESGHSEPQWQRVYDTALIQATTIALDEAESYQESQFLELTERYFHACRKRQQQTRVDQLLAAGDLEQMAEKFQLIEELPTRTLFISRKNADKDLWKRYQKIYEDPELTPSEQEQQFRPFRRHFFDRVIQVTARHGDQLNAEGVNLIEATEDSYNRAGGFIGVTTEEPMLIF